MWVGSGPQSRIDSCCIIITCCIWGGLLTPVQACPPPAFLVVVTLPAVLANILLVPVMRFLTVPVTLSPSLTPATRLPQLALSPACPCACAPTVSTAIRPCPSPSAHLQCHGGGCGLRPWAVQVFPISLAAVQRAAADPVGHAGGLVRCHHQVSQGAAMSAMAVTSMHTRQHHVHVLHAMISAAQEMTSPLCMAGLLKQIPAYSLTSLDVLVFIGRLKTSVAGVQQLIAEGNCYAGCCRVAWNGCICDADALPLRTHAPALAAPAGSCVRCSRAMTAPLTRRWRGGMCLSAGPTPAEGAATGPNGLAGPCRAASCREASCPPPAAGAASLQRLWPQGTGLAPAGTSPAWQGSSWMLVQPVPCSSHNMHWQGALHG